MVREIGVQSQVELYQRLKKWYLMPPCLTLSVIRYGSRVKWSNLGKEVASSPTPQCSSYWKGNLWVTLDEGRQFCFTYYFGAECCSYQSNGTKTSDMTVARSIWWNDRDIRLISPQNSLWIVWQGHMAEWIRCFWVKTSGCCRFNPTRNTYF